MKISANTQLGLMWLDRNAMLDFLAHSKNFLNEIKNKVADIPNDEFEDKGQYNLKATQWNDGDTLFTEICKKLGYNPELKGSEFYTKKHPSPYYYLIQSSVELCADKIRISENFSCSIFSKIKDGQYFYLMGKDEFYTFVKFNGVIRASYWNRKREIAFEFGFHLEKDKYYFPDLEETEFNRLVKLMTFIELGDIEICALEKGRNNGKSKKDGKITNDSNYTVYVVDSSWNKLIIRTDGFAVMGHFRLQACGQDFSDRKLIWIDAFEKHGYARKPRSEIIK